MVDPPRHTGAEHDHESTSGLPRWVRVVVITLIVVVLLIVVVMLAGGGGEHGPGRHAAAIGVVGDHMPSGGGHG